MKVKQLGKRNSRKAIELIREGKNFNLNMGNGKFLTYIDGILQKIDSDGKVYFLVYGKWQECEALSVG